MIRRRDFMFSTCATAAACALPSPADEKVEEYNQKKVDAAIDKGVAYLLGKQDKDGSMHSGSYRTTMSSLSIMAMAAVGQQPSRTGKEGQAVSKALEYVLDPERQLDSGYYGKKDSSRMYGHGIITLMLAEMLGMGVDREQDDKIRDRLKKAVNLILHSQQVKKSSKFKGGWRYEPNAKDADMSVTAWQLIALRGAKNAGIDVPAEAIDLAVAYIKRSFAGHKQKDGKHDYFCYQPGSGGFRFGSATGGLLALQICGEYDAPEVKKAADYLLHCRLKPNMGHFYYGIYYYSQGMYQRKGTYAEHAKKVLADLLCDEQEKDGFWKGRGGSIYGTCMALLSLSVYYHYLPIYQR